MTDDRFNRPNLSWWSVGWNLVGVFTVGLGAYMIAVSDLGRSPDAVHASWFVGGLVTIANGLGLFLVVFNGWHLLAQREIAIHGEQIEIRRWLDVFRRRRGVVVPLGALRDASFIVRGGGAKLKLSSDSPMIFSIWFWAIEDARRFANDLERRGIPVIWDLPYSRNPADPRG